MLTLKIMTKFQGQNSFSLSTLNQPQNLMLKQRLF